MMMSNLHPGFILIAVGLLALLVPKNLRRLLLAVGPLVSLGAVLTLEPGLNATLPFINGITLHYLHVDKLSWVFALIFCMMAAGFMPAITATGWKLSALWLMPAVRWA